jgi:DSF synthase
MSASHFHATQLHRNLDELDVRFEAAERSVWVRMQPSGRPCMTPRLLDAFARAQQEISDLAHAGQEAGDPNRLAYQVLASATPGVFCVGGDLSYFLEVMEEGDREALDAYARRCVDVLYQSATGYGLPFTTIALVQGQALGGGFEAALASSVLIAEEGASFGFPETLFGMFPGMGALSLLTRRTSPGLARRIISSGRIYSSRELYDLGVVDLVVRDGEGEAAVHDLIATRRNRQGGFEALDLATARVNPLSHAELVDVVEIWVDTAMSLSGRNRRLMAYLAAAQERRWEGGGGDAAPLSAPRPAAQRAAAGAA